jgi:hypothetical protein
MRLTAIPRNAWWGHFDFAGNARVQGSNIDIGGYEQ